MFLLITGPSGNSKPAKLDDFLSHLSAAPIPTPPPPLAPAAPVKSVDDSAWELPAPSWAPPAASLQRDRAKVALSMVPATLSTTISQPFTSIDSATDISERTMALLSPKVSTGGEKNGADAIGIFGLLEKLDRDISERQTVLHPPPPALSSLLWPCLVGGARPVTHA